MNTMHQNYLHAFSFLLCTIIAFPQKGFSISTNTIQEVNCTFTVYAPLTLSDVSSLTRKEIEKKLDRNFSLNERFELMTIKRLAKKAKKKNKNLTDCEIIEKKARLSFLFGMIGIFTSSFSFIFGILGIVNSRNAMKMIKKKPECPELKKQRQKAKIGMAIGVVNLLISGFFITLAAITLGS